uniref:YghA n=1 Tax=Caulobacter vibrioides TaxID=155892 RepID=Q9LAV2_CAUVI|nr:YghA [Caulobacter vibrioides]
MDLQLDPLGTALFWLDYAAAAVFGATGALAAARAQHDIITFGFFAAITGVGAGGTLRDLLIGAPVFWVQRPGYILACLAAATVVWLMGKRGWRFRALLWLDALGMAAYAVVGTAKALGLGVHPISAVVMGVLTTAFGPSFVTCWPRNRTFCCVGKSTSPPRFWARACSRC